MKTSSASVNVLLVDDDDGIRRDYSRLLKSAGFVVDTASDGQEATERLSGRSYDVLVSDLSMPRMGGLEFLRAVRRVDLDVPVVLMTGQPDLATAVSAVEYGAFRYLVKPIDADRLLETVKRASTLHALARVKREALEVLGAEGRQLGDRASLEARFENALDKLWMAFQPIVDALNKKAYAYEALARTDEPSLKNPVELLDAAERLGRLHDVGRRIRERVAIAAKDAPEGVLLFVNLHSADLNDPELFSKKAPLTALASRVVLEITERASLAGISSVSGKVSTLRDLGFRLAIDDLGAGYAGLSSFSQLDAEYAKLDMSLVRGVDTSPKKRSVVRAMTRLCGQELDIKVVSEGVETPAERDTILEEGGRLIQGYLYAKPDRGFPLPRF